MLLYFLIGTSYIAGSCGEIMKSKERQYAFRAILIVGFIVFACIFGSYASGGGVPNGWIGDLLTTSYINATAGYYVGASQVIDDTTAATFATVDTGQGANELYDMDQNVLTTSDVNFTSVEADAFFLDSVNKTDIFKYPYSEASYIIRVDNSTGIPVYHAKNETTGVIDYSGPNAATVIQAAIDALPNGGNIFIKSGTYIIEDMITLGDDIHIRGEGWGTILYNADGFNGHPIYALLAERFSIRNIKIDMNGPNQASNGWVALTGVKYYVLDHIWFYNSRTFGLIIQANGDPLTGDLPTHGIIKNCRFDTQSVGSDFAIFNTRYTIITNNFFGGFAVSANFALSAGRTMRFCVIAHNHFLNTQNTAVGLEDIQNVIIRDNVIDGAGGNGIYVKQVNLSDIYRVSIIGNICMNNGADGISVTTNKYSIVTNNICYNNSRDGISTYSADEGIFSNNICYNNNQGGNTAPLGSGIRFSGGNPDRNIITENQCFDNQGISTQTWGIYSGNGDNHTVLGNIVYGNSAGQISVAGANTRIMYNHGFVTENSGSAIIASGAASVVVPHGLAGTPDYISVTGAHTEVESCYVDTIGAVNFTIHKGGAGNVTADRTVYWEAVYKP